jgi:ribosome-associated heat shock protein Hsp15
MTADGRQRIDRWLFFSRIVKSRTLAARLVVAGRVRVNGERIDQAAHSVRPGDVLTISLDRRIAVLEVVAPGERRGPAEEARTLYVDRSPPPAPSDPRLPDAAPALRELGAGRPTKRERRAIDRLTGGDFE